MLAQSRHALLLRRQVVANLREAEFREACEQLHARMALVTEGDVVLHAGDDDEASELAGPPSAVTGQRMHVPALFLDRYTVTNRQYFDFVSAGGYRDATLWDPQVWPAVPDLVDQTGQAGPAFWQHGRYLPGEEDLPVVGVSWYEAQAAARWMGKRLPTDAEWLRAACSPVATDGAAMIQRRFPWGDCLDRGRANLWGSGPNRVVAVTEFAAGASAGGIYQMVGNVWQWNANDFRLSANQAIGVVAPLKSIRGGAFDTYFDNQAACQFESGEYPWSRRHNIGFRCAVGVCDLVLARRRGTWYSGSPWVGAPCTAGRTGRRTGRPGGGRTCRMRSGTRMTRGALQPMKSSDLAHSLVPVSCFVCEAANTRNAEYCRRCSAPMALAYQPLGQTERPKMVALLGPGGSGKTVYLGMLMDMLSREPQRLEIVARGASSIGLQQTTVSALSRCQFPAKTGRDPESWNWMHCEIHRHETAAGEPPTFAERLVRAAPQNRRAAATKKDPRLELVIPDMAGDAIIEEVEHPQTYPVVRALLRKRGRGDASDRCLGTPSRPARPGLCGDEDPAVASRNSNSRTGPPAGRGGRWHWSSPRSTRCKAAGKIRRSLRGACRGNLAALPLGALRLCLLRCQRGRLFGVAGRTRRGPPPGPLADRTARDHRAL